MENLGLKFNNLQKHMKKYLVILWSMFMLCFCIGSCKDDPKTELPVEIASCETHPQPGCPNYVDPEIPTLSAKITVGTTEYTVDSTHIEKIEDGFWYLYAQLKNGNKPLIIHSLRYTTSVSGYGIETWVGQDSVSGKERPSAMVDRYERAGRQVKAAINGGFYNTAVGGTPMSLEVMNGVMTFPPSTDEPQPVIGFDAQNRPYMDYVRMDAKVRDANNRELAFNSVNGTRWADYLVLYNSYMGKHTKTNEWGTEVQCLPMTAQWEKLGSHLNVRCRIEKIESMNGKGNMEISGGNIVLSGNGAAHQYLRTLQVGDYVYVTVDYSLQSSPNITSATIRNAVSGYNIILQRNSIIEPDPALIPDMPLVTSNHPRTSAGFSADSSHIFFTVVEGRRTGLAAGVSTKELAQVMKYLGAANAINLDGGGSSCLMIGKETKNYCTDGSQRAVANGIAIIKN
ncbi:hypothetical protein AGMMS4956_07860 [Bacteroidia bacterium]|nr:hypothetical protein AGMMS4956_07860 [Bacteroidia bacterium]